MGLRPGSRWRSAEGTTEVVVVRATTNDIQLECDGVPMNLLGAAADDVPEGVAEPSEVSVLLGKRYEPADLGVEVLCTKAGSGPLAIGGELLTQKGAKPLPSSD
jgi:hypothetical protein